MADIKGYITKGIGGFYYVETTDGIIECKAKGIFRKRKIIPLAGDKVIVETDSSTYMIKQIDERKNFFIRPPIANVDIFFIVVSTTEPVPSSLVIDKLSAIAEDKGATPVILITKTDLAQAEQLYANYEKSGIQIIRAYNEQGDVSQEIEQLLHGKLCVFCGNSGVGKSTLLNKLLPSIHRETGEISQKLGRGRHTTREVEIFKVAGGLIADTPGFASLENERENFIHKENLQYAFAEMKKFIPDCKFTSCSHTSEKSCAVIKAVQDGEITASRYKSYLTMYEKAKEIKDWEIR